MDVKGYNAFHQKNPPFIEFAISFSFTFNIPTIFPALPTQSLFIGYVVYSLPYMFKPALKL